LFLDNTVTFWAKVAEVTTADGAAKFGQISKLALAILSLPFSNATVERLFSLMNSTHTKIRNRLHVSTVEALLHIRYGLIRRGETCVTFTPSDDMLANFNSSDASTSQHAPDDDAAFISITDNV
jgi:hypothetical protein